MPLIPFGLPRAVMIPFFASIGLDQTTAIDMFFRRVIAEQRLPFQPMTSSTLDNQLIEALERTPAKEYTLNVDENGRNFTATTYGRDNRTTLVIKRLIFRTSGAGRRFRTYRRFLGNAGVDEDKGLPDALDV